LLCASLLIAIERAVGYNNRNASSDGAGDGGVSTTQFFGRFPQLHPLLLAGLRHCTAQALAAGGTCWREDGTFVPNRDWHPYHHPSLHPILLLLSRLRPEVTAGHGLSSGLSVAPFIPLIRLAAVQRHILVRRMAARALAALLPDELVAEVTGSICNALYDAFAARTLTRASTYGLGASAPTGTAAVLAPHVVAAAVVPHSWNPLHGSLLQLEALLGRRVFAPRDNVTLPDAVVSGLSKCWTTVTPALEAILAPQRDSRMAAPAVVIGAAHAVLAAFKHCIPASASLTLPIASVVSAAAGGGSGGGGGPSILGGCLLATEAGGNAVRAALATLFGSAQDHEAVAATCVSDLSAAVLSPDEDYACSALKSLCSCLEVEDCASLWARTATFEDIGTSRATVAQGILAPVLRLLEADRPHPEAARFAAAAAARLCVPVAHPGVDWASAARDTSSSPATWAVLLRAHDATRDGDLRGYCLRALAPLLACLLRPMPPSSSRDLSTIPASVQVAAVLPLLVDRSLSALDVIPSYALRLAATAALRTCGALHPRCGGAGARFHGWCVITCDAVTTAPHPITPPIVHTALGEARAPLLLIASAPGWPCYVRCRTWTIWCETRPEPRSLTPSQGPWRA
jgi:hypothetical protein